MLRRDFLRAVGAAAAATSFLSGRAPGTRAAEAGETKVPASVRVAFLYPPSSVLEAEGYYSWPGSGFDAEGRERQYASGLKDGERDLGVRLAFEEKAIDTAQDAERFIAAVKASPPDGLVLIPLKKSHWAHVVRIVRETRRPTVILATLGVLLAPMVRELKDEPGVYVISSADNIDAVAKGLGMLGAASWMRQARIINIDGTQRREREVPVIGTRVLTVPHERFYSAFAELGETDEVLALARTYLAGAKEIVEPKEQDVVEAAKTTFVLRGILEEEKGDAAMMNCLPGLRKPHKHVPPCMGFLSLRDEGVAMGCESDLDATLTMALLQRLFGTPGFQHNPSADTERNLYFGAHCTAPTRLAGLGAPPEPYILRSHAEAGWGCVPRVLLREGQEVTIAKYLSVRALPAPRVEGAGNRPADEASTSAIEGPRMILYSGRIVGCPPIPPAGGCRTNMLVKLNEIEDPADVQGHHLCLIYGDHVRDLRIFCQLLGIDVVV